MRFYHTLRLDNIEIQTLPVNRQSEISQGEFILARKLNHINLLEIVLDICFPMRYKQSSSYISFEDSCLEPVGDSCPARSSIRRAGFPATDAGASLPGFFAQDWRDDLVHCRLGRPMGSPSELFRFGLEVCCTGSLDRLGLPPSV